MWLEAGDIREWQDDKVRELEQLARRKEDVVDFTQKKRRTKWSVGAPKEKESG